MRSPGSRASEPPGEDPERGEPAGRVVADCGVCAGDVPPLIGQVLTGTGLTLDQAARRLLDGDELRELTAVQRRLAEDRATSLLAP
jgi:hypothetical protein